MINRALEIGKHAPYLSDSQAMIRHMLQDPNELPMATRLSSCLMSAVTLFGQWYLQLKWQRGRTLEEVDSQQVTLLSSHWLGLKLQGHPSVAMVCIQHELG